MGNWAHLRLLLWKNSLLKRRQPWSLCVELFFPALVCVLFYYVQGLFDSTDVPAGWPEYKLDGESSISTTATGHSWPFTGPCTPPSPDVFEGSKFNYLQSVSGPEAIIALGGAQHDGAIVLIAADDKEAVPALRTFRTFVGDNWAPEPLPQYGAWDNVTDIYGDGTTDSALEYIQSEEYGKDGNPKVWAILQFVKWAGFDASSDHKWEYKIRVNETLFANVKTTPTTNQPLVMQLSRALDPSSMSLYTTMGFMTLQMIADKYILNSQPEGCVPVGSYDCYAPQRMSALPMPVAAYREQNFYDQMTFPLTLLFMMCFLFSLSRIVTGMVMEKEDRIREGLKMMGVRDMALVGSWYITYALIFTIASSLITAVCVQRIFAHSSPVLVFLLFWLFGLSIISFCFMVSTLFSKAKTAAIAGVVIFFIFFFMYFLVLEPDAAGKSAASLSSPAAFSLGVAQLAFFEGGGSGVTMHNASMPAQNYAFSTALLMLLLDTLIYSALGWYLNQVVPGQYGTTRKWYFLFTSSYWAGRAPPPPAAATSGTGDARTESVTAELDALGKTGRCVRINNLSKVFDTPDGQLKAVDGLDLTMYEGQIFVLLGHNGAGKSTTISMLTGLLPQTGGVASIYGKDVRTEMDTIRQSLGVCPQHDVLYADLTVKEHLTLYGGIKGLEGDALRARVDEMINDVGLTEKKNERSKRLSGGMKRKLSVAMALVGDSNIVFLDEPTSGMDPYSRRSTWELLRANRAGRVMVLTTHFMEEADLLGDRIAIMGSGQLRCCGSSLWLKHRYGQGYHLTMVKEQACDSDRLVGWIKGQVPGARVLSDVGAEVTMQLPSTESAMFADFFDSLEGSRAELQVSHYGLSATTMEEIFLKVAAGDDGVTDGSEDDADANMVVNLDSPDDGGGEDGDDDYFDRGEDSDENGRNTVPGGLGEAGSRHNTVKVKRNRRGRRSKGKGKAVLGQPLLDSNGSGGSRVSTAMRAERLPLGSQVAALYRKRYCYARRDKKAFRCSTAMPMLLLLIGLSTLKIRSWSKDPPDLVLDFTLFPADFTGEVLFAYNATADFAAVESMIAGTDGMHGVKMFPDVAQSTGEVFGVDYTLGLPKVAGLNGSAFDCLPDFEDIPSKPEHLLVGRQVLESIPEDVFGAAVFTAASEKAFAYTVMVNTTSQHALPIFTSAVNSMILRAITQDAGASIVTHNDPLPRTKTTQALFDTIFSFQASTQTLIVFAFIPASISIFIVKEKESHHNAKHLQQLSGVSITAYWLSNYLWDLTIYGVPCLGTLIMLKVFDISVYVDNGAFPAVAALFLGYGVSIVPFTYLLCYLFDSHAKAQNIVFLINFITGLLLMITSFALDIIESTKHASKALKYFFRLFPGFCMGNGLLNISIWNAERLIVGTADAGGDVQIDALWSWNVVGYDLLYLFSESVVYMLLTIAIDVLLSFPKLRTRLLPDPTVVDKLVEVDQDVRAEQDMVMEQRTGSDAVVVLNNLRKVYKTGKVAVRGLSFAMQRGEVFGFLGINGAGKTTTLKMLTGDVVPSAGSARLCGFDICTEQIALRRCVGYCPQFDALHDLMTVREHLELYALLKGVGKAMVEEVVLDKMRLMDLAKYENKLAGTLSGGNKRKLSVGIALIGDPQILFLDEPSTGVDPVARRLMWDIIAGLAAQKRCSVILTTHSMEECEALCNRVGIMVGGRLRCLGPIQHVKARYGHGFTVEFKLKSPDAAGVDELVLRLARPYGSGTPVTSATLMDACGRLGDTNRAGMITPGHVSGWMIAAQLDGKDKSVPVPELAAWWATETTAMDLTDWMASNFAGAEMTERNEARLTFRVPRTASSLPGVFRLVEGAVGTLRVQEYSVSQTTLEQVFNQFAAQQDEEKGKAAAFSGGGGPVDSLSI